MSDSVQRSTSIAARAARISRKLGGLSHAQRCEYLRRFSELLRQEAQTIIAENKEDCRAAEDIPAALRSRLAISLQKLDKIIEYPLSILQLDDPLNMLQVNTMLDDGLVLERRSVPLGVVLFIFESRPDAFIQMVSLAMKTGNVLLLKPGRESLRTCKVFFELLTKVTKELDMPSDWCFLLEERAEVHELLRCDDHIDLVIPRGSNEFVRDIMKHSNIPVLGHADGNCHIYIDTDADMELTKRIVVDAKTQYVAVCNAVESLLIHKDRKNDIPALIDVLSSKGVTVRGDIGSQKVDARVIPAEEEDWGMEYLDLVVSLRVVESLDEALECIHRYGSKHTDVIITENKKNADMFLRQVDTANAFVNCSSRFSDGYVYGLGAESGVATGKIHARGPVGLEGLCTYKWILRGQGHIIGDYAGTGSFKHKNLLS